MSDELIAQLLQQSAPNLSSNDLRRVVEYSQGFPQMAVLLAKTRGGTASDLESVVHDSLLKKLLGPRITDDTNTYKVLEACAIFSMLGFDGAYQEEYRYVAQKLCKIDPDEFYRHINTTLKARQLVQQAGRFIRVEPLPLAVRLAAKWWRGCSPGRAQELITGDLPGNLAQAMCDRMAQLDFLPEAQELVKALCGDQGPFGQAEVLNSDRGSQLFRSLAEVNPEAALQAMERAFSHWSREQLLHVKDGRRNLVWTLEKLCFPQALFHRAARLMMAFAAAENESWSNNATGQFQQLFHVKLSGTEATPSERVVILDEALRRSDPIYRQLAVETMGEALKTNFFTRTLGPEQIGTAPARQDWIPKTSEDLFNYWKTVLKSLTDVAVGGDELALLARTVIANHIRGLTPHISDALGEAIDCIIQAHGSLWPEAFASIGDTIRFEGRMLPKKIRQQLDDWQKKLSPNPKDLPGRFHLLVNEPSWDDWVEGSDGEFIDLGARNAAALAEEMAQTYPDWKEHLSILFQGEQRKGYGFGKRLGEQLTDPEMFIDQSLEMLTVSEPEQTNMMIFGSFLGAVRNRFPSLVEQSLTRVAATPELHHHLVTLTRLSFATSKELDQILTLVRQEKISSQQASRNLVGGLNHLPREVVCAYCGSLTELDANGAWGALSLLSLYCYGNHSRWTSCQTTLRGILMSPNLKMDNILSSDDTHYWEDASKKLLMNEDLDLAVHLTRAILKASRVSRNILGFDGSANQLLRRLLAAEYRSTTWPLISDALLESNSVQLLSLKRLLGDVLNEEHEHSGVLFTLPDDMLLDWCQAHPDRAPMIIASIMPLFQQNGEYWKLPHLARTTIDRFGSQNGLLDAVSANMGTFSSVGSMVPYYQKRLHIMDELHNHPLDEVRAWVVNQSRYLNEMIKRETTSDQEREWGIL